VARNYAPTMAAAATLTVAEISEPIGEPGDLSPEEIITPGIYVDWVVHSPLAPPRNAQDGGPS
jgi:acyl CoA:acetate/3-ketoacid CoA transferase alpha subunit